MQKLLNQLKARRKELAYTQGDMYQRTGISRQQYQRIESKGNPRLDTLQAIAFGLEGDVVFVPKDKLPHIQELLKLSDAEFQEKLNEERVLREERASYTSESPWKGVLDNWQD